MELRAHVPTVWRYFYSQNKFGNNGTATWLSDMEGCLPSSWFGSTVYLVVTLIRPEGRLLTESGPWQGEDAQSHHTQLHQRKTWRQPALSTGKRLMKHYLWVSRLSSNIPALHDKWFPSHTGNHHTEEKAAIHWPVTPSAHPGCLFPTEDLGTGGYPCSKPHLSVLLQVWIKQSGVHADI